YLDNAATSQKPLPVIESIENYYLHYNSNVHRGVHYLSQLATERYENAREKVRKFINAGSSREINFVRGTTEAVNLVARSYGDQFIMPCDEILITALEHHSNMVPWQMLAARRKAVLKVVPINSLGEPDMESFAEMLSPKTAILAVAHVSNALGTILPVKEMTRMAHDTGAVVLIDGAQATMHMKVDVRDLDADFYAFSGHKMAGPTGIGVLYGKEKHLEAMDPFMGGGEMIKNVTLHGFTPADLPYKFEAGTPNISGGIALGAAIDYLEKIGMEHIEDRDKELLQYASEKMSEIPGIRIIGQSEHKSAVISFLLGDHHPFDVGVLLDKMGVAIRTGHHCCQPLMGLFCITGTCRASFAFYNNKRDVDRLCEALQRASEILG
ncbi:MAG: cysteine desulfurase, partial [Calditrichaeota bacterium]